MAELKYEKYIVKGSSNMPMVKIGRSECRRSADCRLRRHEKNHQD